MNTLRCTAIISTLVIFAWMAVPPAAQAMAPDVIARIDAAMQKSLTESKTTAVVLGVAKNGKLVYERAYGAVDGHPYVLLRTNQRREGQHASA